MKNKVLFIFIVYLAIMPLVAGRTQYEQNQNINFLETIRANDNVQASLSANISITDPDGITLISFGNMTYNANARNYNFTLLSGNTSKLGVYEKCVTAVFLELNKTSCEDFEVTPSGQKFETSQSILYFILLLFSLGVFGLTLFGAIRIPFKNGRDDDDRIFTINNLKYVKIFLWFMTYVVAMWITAIAMNITSNFLFFNSASNFFRFMYLTLLALFYPSIIIFAITSIINVVNDKKIRETLTRRVPTR